ncbi:helix-turn-helix domain-containing protein [Marinifilum caeruleilacunae]|uniref:DNA-binding protein n=1 Tax=Marinifilum caeruleilacunae TaxID=2499076 RepID=A0ABX1X1X3_9BACT|nr:helix-turn-helix domain-containing protein [Marinifilum caeruleilacunae]NOU62267.1 DNA-binding protein [Marinifilum caeruleilacunae]
MNEEQITFEQLPKAVAILIKEVRELRELIESKRSEEPQKRRPIGVKEASKIIMRPKTTIYQYVMKGLLPHFKTGRRLYFYEDELIEWVESGKRKSQKEIMEEIHNEMKPQRGRPLKR